MKLSDLATANALGSLTVFTFASVLEKTKEETQIPSFSVLVNVFMLMFVFMLCSFSRKSYHVMHRLNWFTKICPTSLMSKILIS